MFTVRDLAPLSSRWSSPASERAPSPQSPARSLSSLLSSPPLPLFPLHLIFHSNPISSSSFPFSFHLVLPPTLSFLLSPPSLYLHLSPCPLSPPLPAQPYFSFLPLCPPCVSCLSSFFTLCSKVSERRKGYEEKPDHSGRGILAQPLFLTPGPSAQFICLRRH